VSRPFITRAPQERGADLYESWIRERAPHEAQLRVLWSMTPAQRVAAMYRGELTQAQLFAWAGARPEEVPLLDGEFWFIAIHSADVADADEQERDLLLTLRVPGAACEIDGVVNLLDHMLDVAEGFA